MLTALPVVEMVPEATLSVTMPPVLALTVVSQRSALVKVPSQTVHVVPTGRPVSVMVWLCFKESVALPSLSNVTLVWLGSRESVQVTAPVMWLLPFVSVTTIG